MTIDRHPVNIRKTAPVLPVVRQNGVLRFLASILPGLALTFGIALVALLVQRLSGIAALSPLIVAIVLGMAIRNVAGPIAIAKPGITFSLRRVLRFAIVLLGMQLTIWQVMEIGPTGFAIIVATLVSSFVFIKATGRALGVDRKLAELIAAGTSICGASAVIATNTVTRAHEEDVAYAIACVTVFGSIAMLLLPVLAPMLDLAPNLYGLWAGATIHEVAQVVAAAFQGGEVAGQFGTVAKLSRVMLLAPLILALGFMQMRRARSEPQGGAGVPVPWFVFGFIAMMLVNSVVSVPADIHSGIVTATSFLLAAALAAMGLETDIGKLRAKGIRPLALGAIGTVFITGFGLTLILLFM